MRGKKDTLDDYYTGLGGLADYEKRAPMGFQGMRGKKDNSKVFTGMRGKRNIPNIYEVDDEADDYHPRLPMNLLGQYLSSILKKAIFTINMKISKFIKFKTIQYLIPRVWKYFET